MRVLNSWQLMAAAAVTCAAAGVILLLSPSVAVGVPTDDGLAAAASPAAPQPVAAPAAPRVSLALPPGLGPISSRGTVPRPLGPAGPPAASPGSPGSPAPLSGITRPAPADDVAAPIRVRIPAIGVDGDMIPLAVDADRRIEVPEDAAQAGWWADGPDPGQRGASVVLGHVDSHRGPGIFYGLNLLAPGDEIRIDRADGTTVVYRVERGALYTKDDFPNAEVYDRRTSRRLLRLVTCGGEFDRATRSYEANYVIYAEQVRVEEPATTGVLA